MFLQSVSRVSLSEALLEFKLLLNAVIAHLQLLRSTEQQVVLFVERLIIPSAGAGRGYSLIVGELHCSIIILQQTKFTIAMAGAKEVRKCLKKPTGYKSETEESQIGFVGESWRLLEDYAMEVILTGERGCLHVKQSLQSFSLLN